MRRFALVACALALAAPAATAATPETLPDGATIAGVAVGGMDAATAKQAVTNAVAPVYDNRAIAIRVAHHDTLVMPAQAGLVVAYDWMVNRAFAFAGAGKPVAVPLHLGVAKKKLQAA